MPSVEKSMERIESISFILIARNEAYGVNKCLSSLAAMDLQGCEVICVDSGSDDGTLDVMCSFSEQISNLQILTVKGYSNAAIARNAGLRRATRKFIFFVDGDVEINAQFLIEGVRRLKIGVGAVTGRLRELQYTRDFKTVLKEIPDRFYIQGEGRIFASGGCFIATKSAVEATGLFDDRLERSQDYDYTLRLSRRYTMIAIAVSMGTHHTVGYDDKLRLTTHLKKFYAVFFGTALRRNLANVKGIYWLLTKRERGIALGGLLLAGGAVAVVFWGMSGVVGLCACLGTDILLGIKNGDSLLYRFYLHYIFPLLVLAGGVYTIDRRRPYMVEEVSAEQIVSSPLTVN